MTKSGKTWMCTHQPHINTYLPVGIPNSLLSTPRAKASQSTDPFLRYTIHTPLESVRLSSLQSQRLNSCECRQSFQSNSCPDSFPCAGLLQLCLVLFDIAKEISLFIAVFGLGHHRSRSRIGRGTGRILTWKARWERLWPNLCLGSVLAVIGL